MKKALYIGILSLLLVASVSGIAFLVYPDFEAVAVTGAQPVVSAAAGIERDGGGAEQADYPLSETEPDGGAAAGAEHRDDPPAPTEPERGSIDPPALNEAATTGGALYLILDDGGHTLEHLRWFREFDGVFTVAVLPGLEYSAEVARMTVALGHDLILHQPMEALGGNDPGPGAIYTTDDTLKIRRTVRRNLAQFPDVIGVNNHMGSKATTDQRVMDAVVGVLANRDLFFLDSRTTHTSVAVGVAAEAGLPQLQRDVFLDNVRTEEAISRQIDAALAVADAKGYAVMIGHLTSSELARVLVKRYDAIVAAGYRFAPLHALVTEEVQRIAHEGTGN